MMSKTPPIGCYGVHSSGNVLEHSRFQRVAIETVSPKLGNESSRRLPIISATHKQSTDKHPFTFNFNLIFITIQLYYMYEIYTPFDTCTVLFQ